jgi:hypothetical protein
MDDWLRTLLGIGAVIYGAILTFVVTWSNIPQEAGQGMGVLVMAVGMAHLLFKE